MSQHPPLPETGFLDLHCHILPGIDDGCRELAESLRCVQLWHDVGYRGAVCTPHVCTTWFPANNPLTIAAWVRELQTQIDRAELRFDLWPGGEVRLAQNTIAWFAEFGIPTVGPGRAVLIDWWGRDWPDYCDATIEHLLAANYQPVLAHPERMGLEESELRAVLARLQAQGVWLQGNLNSLAGGEGKFAQSFADELLGSDRYYLLASDTHGPDSVSGRQDGLSRVRQKFGQELLETMLYERPRAVMTWGLSSLPK